MMDLRVRHIWQRFNLILALIVCLIFVSATQDIDLSIADATPDTYYEETVWINDEEDVTIESMNHDKVTSALDSAYESSGSSVNDVESQSNNDETDDTGESELQFATSGSESSNALAFDFASEAPQNKSDEEEDNMSEIVSTTGVTIYAACAVCGNWYQESTCNPGVWENYEVGEYTDIGKGYGLGQWTNVGSSNGRLYQLYLYLTQNGYELDSGDGQVAYFMFEQVWSTYYSQAAKYSSLNDFLASGASRSDIYDMAYAFLQGWEGIDNGTEDKRGNAALEAYDYVIQHYNDSSISTWYTSNSVLSTSQWHNNAVLICRLLCGGISKGHVTGKFNAVHCVTANAALIAAIKRRMWR